MKEMVFSFQNCSVLLWEKKSSDQEKLLKFEVEGKIFEITRKIYSNNERSEFFFRMLFQLVRLGFSNQYIIKIQIQIGKK